jgi:hypothetical protein
MQYYKHPETGEVFAYESEQERQEWGAPELVEMTPEEIDAHLNPPPAPPYVPQQVTRAQGKAALIQAGLWGDVEDYVDGIEDPTEKALALVALNDTTHWQRTSPFLNAAAAALGLTDEQLDDLFRQAAKIEL